MSIFIDPTETVSKEVGGTKFRIRVLTSRQMAKLAVDQGILGSEGKSGLSEELFTHYRSVIMAGVAGWDDGPEYKEENGMMAESCLDRIPLKYWTDLYMAVIEVNTPTEQDIKNSPSPQQ